MNLIENRVRTFWPRIVVPIEVLDLWGSYARHVNTASIRLPLYSLLVTGIDTIYL